MSNIELEKINNAGTFTLGGYEFIKFLDEDGKTAVVTKDIVFKSAFGENNNLAESSVIKRLTEEFLPKIIEAAGEENVCEFETDLTTLDGLKPYANLKSKVSLPTFDFYRANVEVFDKYNPKEYWWTATPDTAQPHYKPRWITCVSPSGYFDFNGYYHDSGVRPFLILKSNIVVSEV